MAAAQFGGVASASIYFNDLRDHLGTGQNEVRILVGTYSDAFGAIEPMQIIEDGIDSCTQIGLKRIFDLHFRGC